jgi:hypothetical protein
MDTKPHAKHRGRLSRRTWIILAVVAGILIATRLALPYGIEHYVNRQLKRAPDYGGRIGTVTVHLWRGAYRIKDIAIYKKTGKIKEPLFAAKVLDLSIEWRQLFHGAVVGAVVMEEPVINFETGPTEDQTQLGKNAPWNQILESLFPFDINRLEIVSGQIHFQNHYSSPPVDIYASDVSAVATNLTNASAAREQLPSGLTATGKTLGNGGLSLGLRLNSMVDPPAFEIVSQLTNVDLVELNGFLKAYGKFDVKRGVFNLYTSVAARDGNFDGYFKTFFTDMDVFDWQKEKEKNPFQIAWEAMVGTVATALKNHRNDTLATKIPISGSYGKSKVSIWIALGNLLQNGFIKALTPKVDEHVTVGQVEKKAQAEAEEKAPAHPASPDGKAATTSKQ